MNMMEVYFYDLQSTNIQPYALGVGGWGKCDTIASAANAVQYWDEVSKR